MTDPKAIFNAHVQLIKEMGAQDDRTCTRSTATMWVALGEPERCTDANGLAAVRPDSNDPWVARAVAIIEEWRAK